MLSIRELRDRAIIRPIKRAVEDQLLDLPGVVAVDIGEKITANRRTGRQVIVVAVAHKKRTELLVDGAEIPPDILGIPTDVIEEEPVLHHDHRTTQEVELLQAKRSTNPRAVLAGGGIAPCRPVLLSWPDGESPGEYRRIGTLGALVVGHAENLAAGDVGTTGMTTMGLTTFDVACMDDAWAVGDQMIDPDAGHCYADLARAALSGRVDAAAVTLNAGLDPAYVIGGLGPITGQCAAYPGETVHKRGYGTGLTTGTVRSTDMTLRIDHGEALGVRILREQLRVRATSSNPCFAGRGDAGAALVNADGRVVGLHFGGSRNGTTGYACPIGDVLAELDVDLCVEPQRLRV